MWVSEEGELALAKIGGDATIQAMKHVGVDPAIIHAFEKTGLIVTDLNQHLLKGADLEDWNAAIDEFKATGEEPQFPIGTVALYGPDDKTTTKIVAGVIKEEAQTRSSSDGWQAT